MTNSVYWIAEDGTVTGHDYSENAALLAKARKAGRRGVVSYGLTTNGRWVEDTIGSDGLCSGRYKNPPEHIKAMAKADGAIARWRPWDLGKN